MSARTCLKSTLRLAAWSPELPLALSGSASHGCITQNKHPRSQAHITHPKCLQVELSVNAMEAKLQPLQVVWTESLLLALCQRSHHRSKQRCGSGCKCHAITPRHPRRCCKAHVRCAAASKHCFACIYLKYATSTVTLQVCNKAMAIGASATATLRVDT